MYFELIQSTKIIGNTATIVFVKIIIWCSVKERPVLGMCVLIDNRLSNYEGILELITQAM